MSWKDVSSYSRDDKVREPMTWEKTAGRIRIVVTRRHRLDPKKWFLICDALNIDCRELESEDADEAKREAEGTVLGMLGVSIAELEGGGA